MGVDGRVAGVRVTVMVDECQRAVMSGTAMGTVVQHGSGRLQVKLGQCQDNCGTAAGYGVSASYGLLGLCGGIVIRLCLIVMVWAGRRAGGR